MSSDYDFSNEEDEEDVPPESSRTVSDRKDYSKLVQDDSEEDAEEEAEEEDEEVEDEEAPEEEFDVRFYTAYRY